MSILWASVYEQVQDQSRQESVTQSVARTCANAALVATLAYVVDYGVAPRRLRPGFKKHLGSRSIFFAYTAFGAGLVLASLLAPPRHR